MKSLSTLFAVLAFGVSLSASAHAQQVPPQKIEVNDSLCITGKDAGGYKDAIKLLKGLSKGFNIKVSTEAFSTDAGPKQDIADTKHGFTFLKVSAAQTGYLMFNNEKNTSCQIKQETFDGLRKQLHVSTHSMVLK